MGLAILGLIIMSVFAAFPFQDVVELGWEISLESTYAASIMELLRNNSLLLQEQVIEDGCWTAVDNNYEDEVFSFVLGACLWKWQCLLECLPELMPGFLMIMPIMTAYQLKVLIKLVAGGSSRGIFHGSLIEVNVKIDWLGGREGYLLSTIICSR